MVSQQLVRASLPDCEGFTVCIDLKFLFNLPTTHYQLPTIDYQLPTSNYRLPTTDYQLPTTDYRLPTTNSFLSAVKPPPTFHQGLLVDFWLIISLEFYDESI